MPDAGQAAEESALVERARHGDQAAFGELVRRHQELAFRAAWLITRDAGIAEDAAQEGFIKAYRALGRFRSGAPFRPWLLRIVGNEARNRRRSISRHPELPLRSGGTWVEGDRAAGPEPADRAPSPEEAALQAETREALHVALRALSEDDRQVIACRYLLQLSEAETAEMLGVPRGTVKSRLSRGLERLRARLQETHGTTGRADV